MRRKLTFSLIAAAAFAAVVLWLASSGGMYYRTYSPDRQYSVYAESYNWECFIAKAPGGSGDASGKAILYDEVEHRVINSAAISMISNVSDIQWAEYAAYFVGEEYPDSIDPWKLPRPIRRPNPL